MIEKKNECGGFSAENQSPWKYEAGAKKAEQNYREIKR